MEESDPFEVQKDDLFPNAEKQKAARTQEAVRIANLYQVFEHGPGKELLALWTKLVRSKKIPVDASVQEYAAHNANREFVEGIYQQLEFSHNRGNSPQ